MKHGELSAERSLGFSLSCFWSLGSNKIGGLKLKEVASALGVSTSTVKRYLTEGWIPAKHCKRLRGFRDTVTSFSDSLIPIRRYREKDTGVSSSLERCGNCGPPLLRRLADSLHPDSRTLYPESGNRDWVRGHRRVKEQDTGFKDTGCGGNRR